MKLDRRHFILGAAMASVPAPVFGRAALAPRELIAWRGRTGLNVFWPFGGPVAHQGRYLEDPYATSASGHFSSHIDTYVIDQIKAAKIDHVRLQVSPGPWLQAVRSGSSLDFLDRSLDLAVDALVRAGVAVLLSPYLSSYTDVDVPAAILEDISGPAYIAFRAVLVRWARKYSKRDPALFALELMNEPPAPSDFAADWQGRVQPDLYKAVRAAAPATTIVLTAEGYGSLYLMGSMAPEGYDHNVLFTFHPFLPSCFCFQGAAYDRRYKYITGLSYPPRQRERMAVLDMIQENLRADVALEAKDREALGQSLCEEVERFFSSPGYEDGQDVSWINAQFNLVEAWAVRTGVPSSAIYVGEWGAVRQNHWHDSAGRLQGGNSESRARYYSDMAAVISRCGFRSSLDHLDTYDYGVTTGTGERIAEFDPSIVGYVTAKLGKQYVA